VTCGCSRLMLDVQLAVRFVPVMHRILHSYARKRVRPPRGWTYIGTGSHVKAVRVGQRGCPDTGGLEMSGFIGADHALREARPGSQFCLRDARIAAAAARCRDPSELNVGTHGYDAALWQAEEIYRALRRA
jgi:hypothetical protein